MRTSPSHGKKIVESAHRKHFNEEQKLLLKVGKMIKSCQIMGSAVAEWSKAQLWRENKQQTIDPRCVPLA